MCRPLNWIIAAIRLLIGKYWWLKQFWTWNLKNHSPSTLVSLNTFSILRSRTSSIVLSNSWILKNWTWWPVSDWVLIRILSSSRWLLWRQSWESTSIRSIEACFFCSTKTKIFSLLKKIQSICWQIKICHSWDKLTMVIIGSWRPSKTVHHFWIHSHNFRTWLSCYFLSLTSLCPNLRERQLGCSVKLDFRIFFVLLSSLLRKLRKFGWKSHSRSLEI